VAGGRKNDRNEITHVPGGRAHENAGVDSVQRHVHEHAYAPEQIQQTVSRPLLVEKVVFPQHTIAQSVDIKIRGCSTKRLKFVQVKLVQVYASFRQVPAHQIRSL
jgi:hypothetical protein